MADFAEIILDGHGAWVPAKSPAYAQVPKGTTINFMTGNFKIQMRADVTDEESALDSLAELRGAEPNQVGQPYGQVPNYVLSENTEDSSQVPAWVVQVHEDTPLCTNDGSDPTVVCGSGVHRCDGLFADSRVIGATLYWAACRFVDLAAAGSPVYYAESGVNQRQPTLGPAGEDSPELSNSGADLWIEKVAELSSDEDALKSFMDEAKGALSDDQFQMVGRRIEERFPEWAAANGI